VASEARGIAGLGIVISEPHDRGRLQPLDVDDTPQRRHQVVFVGWRTRAASTLRVLVEGVEVAFLPIM
jgi:hypothetical protein